MKQTLELENEEIGSDVIFSYSDDNDESASPSRSVNQTVVMKDDNKIEQIVPPLNLSFLTK